jgi:hypothetical protein
MPNKASSKAQYRFFRAVESGSVKAPGLSSEKASEMIGHQSPKGLPERAKKPPRSIHGLPKWKGK